MNECKTLEYHRVKQKEYYHTVHPEAPYRNSTYRVDLTKPNGKICIICKDSLLGRQLKYCSFCRYLPHCCKCGKLKEKGRILCDLCKQKGIEESRDNHVKQMRAFRKTDHYREYLEAQYPTHRFKVRMAVAQRTYAATPKGRLRINYLHNRRYHELRGLPYISFEQYSQQKTLRNILPVRVVFS